MCDGTYEKEMNYFIESMLAFLNYYRKNQPKSEEEKEMVENVYDCLYQFLLIPQSIAFLIQNQGIELLIGILK